LRDHYTLQKLYKNCSKPWNPWRILLRVLRQSQRDVDTEENIPKDLVKLIF
jgi:hypothetical protein